MDDRNVLVVGVNQNGGICKDVPEVIVPSMMEAHLNTHHETVNNSSSSSSSNGKLDCNGTSHRTRSSLSGKDVASSKTETNKQEDLEVRRSISKKNGCPYGQEHEMFTEVTVTDEKPLKKFLSKWKHWIILISLAYGNLANGACISLQTPFFPKEAEQKGATPFEYGLVIGCYQLTMFICAPICGKLISYTNPKLMLYAGMFIVGSSAMVFGLIDRAPDGWPFLALAFTIRIAEGIGAAMLNTGLYSYIAANFASTMATTFTSLEMFFGLGLIVGPTLGGILYDIGGYQLPFFIVGSVTVLDSILKFVILDSSGGRKQQSGDLLKFYLNIGVWLYILILFTTFVLIGFNTATLEPHLRMFHLSGFSLGAMCAIQGAVYSVTAPLWGRLCDKGVNCLLLGIGGSILTATSLVLIGPLPFIPLDTKVYYVGISLGIMGLGVGGKIVCTFIGALKDTIARGFPADVSTYGLASSMIFCSLSFGSFVGPSMGGYLLQEYGFRTATLFLFVFEILVILLLVAEQVSRYVRGRRSPELTEHTPLLPDGVFKSV